jgi:hypothetical protein
VKTNDHAVAAGHSVDPARWQEAFEAVMSRIASRFARVEPRCRVRDLVRGLLSDLPRKNCWTIAEWAWETSPDGMQHLLGRAKWDADAVRDDVREYMLEHLHDEDAVLIVDETGDVKKGTHTVGVQPRSSSHPGRADPAHLQRDPATVHHASRPARARCGPPAPLVRLATPPSGPSPGQPLPRTSRESDMKITIYGWSNRRPEALPEGVGPLAVGRGMRWRGFRGRR